MRRNKRKAVRWVSRGDRHASPSAFATPQVHLCMNRPQLVLQQINALLQRRRIRHADPPVFQNYEGGLPGRSMCQCELRGSNNSEVMHN